MQVKESRTGGHRVDTLPMHVKSDATEEIQPLESLIIVGYHPKMIKEERVQRTLRIWRSDGFRTAWRSTNFKTEAAAIRGEGATSGTSTMYRILPTWASNHVLPWR